MEPKNKNLVVHQVDETNNTITGSLGILPDREKEIEKILEVAWARIDSVTDAFVEISEQVKHPNEFALAIFWLGSKMSKMSAATKTAELLQLVLKLRKSED